MTKEKLNAEIVSKKATISANLTTIANNEAEIRLSINGMSPYSPQMLNAMDAQTGALQAQNKTLIGEIVKLNFEIKRL